MLLQQGAQVIDISLVKVDRDARQRKVIETADLEKSIARRGLLNPIIIDSDFQLKAGERRLTACRNLGHTQILVRFVEQLSPHEAQIIELEENIKRQDLEWQDLAKAIFTIHQLFCAMDPIWTMAETAEECCLTPGTISLYLSVYAQIEDKKVAEAATVREAYNMLKRREQRAQGNALEELLFTPDAAQAAPEGAPAPEVEALNELGQPLPRRLVVPTAPVPVAPPPESILHESFLKWAPSYTGKKFNLVHCDFPYGVNLFDGPQGRGAEPTAGYKDTESTYQELLHCFCANIDRFMSVSAHLMFWLTAETKVVTETVQTFNRLVPSLSFSKFPLIWQKSDNSGIASDPRMGPRHVYEMCLFASRGQRQIVQVKADAYSAGIDKELHPSTKPEPMLRHFMTMLVDENTVMLDPTCGSASSLRAAESLGAKFVLGLEADLAYVEPARRKLRQFRALRAASEKIA